MRNIQTIGLLLSTIALSQAADLERYFSDHFKDWLDENGYGSYGFHRPDLAGSCYGGKLTDDEQISHDPVIFIHGNGDIAVGYDYWQTGFSESIQYFQSMGHTRGELYATTWGPASLTQISKQVHSREYLEYLRAFVEAVLAYTGAEKVDIISHSMGVTLARKVVKGGYVAGVGFDLGEALTSRVDAFVGIAGGNYGLTSCAGPMTWVYDTCNDKNGFFPGWAPGIGLSEYLDDMNHDGTKEGSYVASVLSTWDDVILFGDLVWGQFTSQWPTEDTSVVYMTPEYSHLYLRDGTAALQYSLVVNHQDGAPSPTELS